eukprot:Tbor_TRINITY_DN5588_c0_g1::TRINITY_DN5588_c0_g1_i1::g.12541::m.12541/K01897/ACSL, fadD; long-chain acyl-CoA synthetase
MGGCVMSHMQGKHESSLVPHTGISKLRQSPCEVVLSGPSEDENCSGIYSNMETKDLTKEQIHETFYNGTLTNTLKKRVDLHPDVTAIAWRPVSHVEKTTIKMNGKDTKWEYIHYEPTKYMTCKEMWETIVSFGRGLLTIGGKSGCRVGIYEDTRYEWLLGCYGIWSQDMIAVTVYASLGEDALIYAMKEAEVSHIITNGKLVKHLIEICNKGGVTVPVIIYTDKLTDANDDAYHGISLNKYDSVVAAGAKEKTDLHIPTCDETAIIMYTSGTTGDPKGVVMTHGNVYAAVRSVEPRLLRFFGEPSVAKKECYIAYLPLAHILEFTAENAMFIRGALIAYGNPRTLTNTAAKPHGDLQEHKPTFIVGVPRVFDTIKKVIESRVPSGLKGKIFRQAYEERLKCLHQGLETPFYNEKVFGNIRQVLGGRCITILSGGAPLSAKTQEFMMVVTGATVVQGYGLTENCAITTTQLPWEIDFDIAGSLLPGVEIKLRDVDVWKHTDPEPSGEILMRGPTLSKGYFKQPAMTADVFKDGWFHTGDVGRITNNNYLKIVGRTKALAKNSFGEYVALDALESVYVLDELCVANGVCVVVDPHKSFICALVLTDEEKATKFAKKHNIKGEWPAILENASFQEKAAESLAITAKEHGKKPFECVKKVRVLNEEWTPENGILTAASKLKRRTVDEKHKDTITELFKETL